MMTLRIPYRPPTGADFRAAIAARELQIEERNRDPEVRAAVAAAIAQARAAAALLRDEFGATRVRLFGSVARGDTNEDFDVDLAAEGIPRRRYFAAWAAAGLLVGRKLDLVDLEDAPALLRQRIEEDGVDLL